MFQTISSQMVVRSALYAGHHLLLPGRFLLLISVKRLRWSQGHSAAGRVGWFEKSSDLIRIWTCDLPACSIVLQPAMLLRKGNRDSVVGIVTGCGLVDRGVWVWVLERSRIFSFSHCPEQLWGPPSPCPVGIGGSFPRCKAARTWNWLLTSN
jgi:hypothetical protein